MQSLSTPYISTMAATKKQKMEKTLLGKRNRWFIRSERIQIWLFQSLDLGKRAYWAHVHHNTYTFLELNEKRVDRDT